MVDGIGLHLVENLAGVVEGLGDVAEHLVHLLTGLKPLLLGIQHAGGIVEVLAGGEAEQMVVGLGIVLIHEMGIVGAHQFDAILTGQFDDHLVGLLLQGEGLAVGPLVGILHLMALEFEIIVIAENALVPLDGLTGSLDVALEDLVGHLAGDAGRTDDETLMKLLQVGVVGAGTHIEAVNPGARHEFDEILITLIVLGQNDEVPSTLVMVLLATVGLRAAGHIHLATENRLEFRLAFGLPLLVDLVAIVKQFLDTHHVAMIGDGHAAHAVGQGFIDKFVDARLSVEDGIIRMYVQVDEISHRSELTLKVT